LDILKKILFGGFTCRALGREPLRGWYFVDHRRDARSFLRIALRRFAKRTHPDVAAGDGDGDGVGFSWRTRRSALRISRVA
jgi:hypothetical protein